MKNWWLELYTIPYLKQLVRAYLIVLAVTLTLVFLMPDFLFIMFYGQFYILYSLKNVLSQSIYMNIEFHKLHVPFGELRPALIKNLLITGSSTFLALSSIWYLIVSYDPMDFGDMKYAVLGFSLLVSFGGFYRVVRTSRPGILEYELMDGKKYKYVPMFIYMFLAFVIVFITGVLDQLLFSPALPLVLFLLSLILGYTLFIYKAVFHLEVKKGSPKNFFKYGLIGTGYASALMVTLLLAGRPLVTMTSVDPELRHMIFTMSGPLAPELEIEDGKDLLAVDSPEIALIFTKTPGLEQVPVSELWTKPNSRNFADYLLHVKNPSVDNMTYILTTIAAKKKHTQFDRAVAQLMVEKWPKNQKLPDHLVAKKIKKEEIPKEERLPASDKSAE